MGKKKLRAQANRQTKKCGAKQSEENAILHFFGIEERSYLWNTLY